MAHYHSDIPSAAHIGGHPIHPMLVPFPIAFLVTALVTDLAYLNTEDPFWALASLWLLRAGLVMGVLAAVFGLIDFYARRTIRDHKIAWYHFIGNATVLILAWINLSLRNEAPIDGLTPGGVILSAVVAGILLITAWLGGEMAYRYHIGSIPAGRESVAGDVTGSTGSRPSTVSPAYTGRVTSEHERRSGGDRRNHAFPA
jgi:uncharacterized membrane protein